MPQIELAVRTAYPEFADEILCACGAMAVTVTDAGDRPILEPAPGDTPLWPDAWVSGLFPQDADADAIVARLRELLPDGTDAAIRSRSLDDADWLRICRQGLEPMRFGRRLLVLPDGHEPGDDDAVILRMDPGLAFGTGSHPTTAMCLRWLDALAPEGMHLLDWGCGSGILAIASVLLGARQATAVDIDPQALRATGDNAARNGVAPRLSVHAPEDAGPGPYDALVANILAGPLIALAPTLGPRLAPGAPVALAGLLAGQADAVARAWAPWCRLKVRDRIDDWVLLAGRRGPAERA